MTSALDLIRGKIADLESRLVNLRIAEQELLKLEKSSSPKVKTTPKAKAAKLEPVESDEPTIRQTNGTVIIGILSEHGALSAKGISEQIEMAGKDIGNRAVSFTLQSMKKRGLVKNVDGTWALTRAGVKQSAT